MAKNGWVKIHRCIEDAPWYKDANTSHLAQHLIRKANHEAGEIMFNRSIIRVERGQLVTGLFTLSHETGATHRKLRTSLEILRKCSFLTLQPTQRYTIITICNYELYQQSDNQCVTLTDKEATNSRQTDVTLTDNKQEVKKEKKERNIGAFAKPTLDEVTSFITSKGWSVDPVAWYSHYESNGWRVGRNPMRNWRAAVLTWQRKASQSEQVQFLT